MKKSGSPVIFDPSEIDEIELFVNARSRELTSGERQSAFTGISGIEFASIRDWEPGDQRNRVDWGHSSRSNFSELTVRESVEERTTNVALVLDASKSAYCGMQGGLTARTIAHAAAAIGFSAAVTQDVLGAVLFGEGLVEVPSKAGRGHVFALIEEYAEMLAASAAGKGAARAISHEEIVSLVSGILKRPGIAVVISDFLFPDAQVLAREMGSLESEGHDVCMLMTDSASAFALPDSSSGWIVGADVETGAQSTFSRREIEALGAKARAWQESVRKAAEKAGIDTLILPGDRSMLSAELFAFFSERRSSK
jgi:uncharacterized protein (DUF58 family)